MWTRTCQKGHVRSYSLIEWDETCRRVTVAVKAELEGRGGSLAVHRLPLGAALAPGDRTPEQLPAAP